MNSSFLDRLSPLPAQSESFTKAKKFYNTLHQRQQRLTLNTIICRSPDYPSRAPQSRPASCRRTKKVFYHFQPPYIVSNCLVQCQEKRAIRVRSIELLRLVRKSAQTRIICAKFLYRCSGLAAFKRTFIYVSFFLLAAFKKFVINSCRMFFVTG